MAEDFAALRTALATNVRYDAHVRSGNNGGLVELLRALEPGQTVLVDISRFDAIKAFKNDIRVRTPQQLQRLRLLMDSDLVGTSDPDVFAELADIFGATSPATARLTVVATQDATYGDAFGYPQVGLDVVRIAVRLITKSFIVSTGQI